MKLKSTVIKNYRGIKEETLVSFQDFNCIVGKNDVGKSTLLKAIDAFLNENNPNILLRLLLPFLYETLHKEYVTLFHST